MTAMNPRRVNLRLSMLHLSRRPQWSRSCSPSLVLPGELPVTWLYGSGHNIGRTAGVISLLGPAGHPGGRDPGAWPGGASTRRGEASDANAAAAAQRAAAADGAVHRPVPAVRRGTAGHH